MSRLLGMEKADFSKTWSDLNHERLNLEKHRDALELDLLETRNKIAHLEVVLDHLEPLGDMVVFAPISQLGLTDAIRMVLQKAKDERHSANDVREKLSAEGYDFSGLTAPMASVYKVLNRLAEKPEQVQREKEEYRVYFKWVGELDCPF